MILVASILTLPKRRELSKDYQELVEKLLSLSEMVHKLEYVDEDANSRYLVTGLADFKVKYLEPFSHKIRHVRAEIKIKHTKKKRIKPLV